MRRTFQKWLFIFVVAAFIITFSLSFFIQTKVSEKNAVDLLGLRLSDAYDMLTQNRKNLATIEDITKAAALAKAHAFSDMLALQPSVAQDKSKLSTLLKTLDVDELHIIDEKGFITSSTVEAYIGYDMASADQSKWFMQLLDDPALELVQEIQAIGYDNTKIMQYVGVARSDEKGFIQIGYVPERVYEAAAVADIASLAEGFRVGESGFILVSRDNEIISAEKQEFLGMTLDELQLSETEFEENSFNVVAGGKEYIGKAIKKDNYALIALLPADEMFMSRDSMTVFLILFNLIIFLVVFFLVSALIQRVVIRGIVSVNASLTKITEGDLEEVVAVKTNPEFISLSEGINSTVGALKKAIAEAEARIDEELEFAKAIQHSAMPGVFPPYPDRTEFDLFACMYTAKEVGGDFYDFFLIDDDHLAVVIADVSGKGVPASLFMMTSKTLIKSLAESGMPAADVFTTANKELCSNNDAGMFVTAWMGILEISSGRLIFVNAGHNPPFLKKHDSDFGFLKSTPGFVLAGMDGIKYTSSEIQLEPGSVLYLYTDGVTEAGDQYNNMYGEKRLQSLLNAKQGIEIRELLDAVKADVESFVQGTPQFDDITMLGLKINKPIDSGLDSL